MGTNSTMKLKLARAMRHVTPMHIVKTRVTRKTIQNFAERVGMVYFGYVNQHDDDHRLVRGHTVSHTHVDNHLCVGTIKNYDATLLLRNDTLRVRQSDSNTFKNQNCHWLIATVDLHTEAALPHIYIGLKRSDNIYQAAYSALKPLPIGALGRYSQDFLQKYTIYGLATNALEIERIIPPQVADILVTHFAKINIEIQQNTIYLYSENESPTSAQLEKIMSNAIWLAEVIDTHYRQ